MPDYYFIIIILLSLFSYNLFEFKIISNLQTIIDKAKKWH